MRLIRRVAHLLLAWIFIQGGLDALRKPEGRAEIAGQVLDKIREVAPVSLPDDIVLVRANAGVQATAGTGLAIGVFPRTSASVLVASLIPTTIGGHPFWTIEDPAQRRQQRTHFLKNLAMLGGLLLAAAEARTTNGITK